MLLKHIWIRTVRQNSCCMLDSLCKMLRLNIGHFRFTRHEKYFSISCIKLDSLSSSLLSYNLKIKIYRTIISPVVLYGCETWSLTLSEERKLRVFENRVLRRIFGPKTT